MTVPREERILDAAAQLFHERGYHAVKMDDIGARAGITGPAVYRHFKSKDAILTILFEMAFDRFFEMVGPRLENTTVELTEVMRGHLQLVLEELEWASVAVRESRSLPAEARKRLALRERRYTARWVDVISRRYPDLTETEHLAVAYTLLATLNSVVNWPPQALSLPNRVELVIAIALEGLTSLAERPALRPA